MLCNISRFMRNDRNYYVRYDARNVSVNKIFICQIEVNFIQHKTLDQRRSKRNCNIDYDHDKG